MSSIQLTRNPILCSSKYHSLMKSVTSKYEGYNSKLTLFTLHFTEDLTEAETSAVLAANSAFVDSDPQEYVKTNILAPACLFGHQAIEDFTVENIMLGITKAGLTSHIRKTCNGVLSALGTGSLYDAITEIRLIPIAARDPIFLSDSRMLKLLNRIETYLGIPLSTTV